MMFVYQQVARLVLNYSYFDGKSPIKNSILAAEIFPDQVENQLKVQLHFNNCKKLLSIV
jgi:hypothetical protein